ncbi:uncharacterized protein LOC113795919 [Dermatophagoides pteronyssinus]|uniref:uncharacterized protein LOC113795919 n=1 Tax=Dermatophagoides pteronyssinus TaxID=6956 RepID=UPI003F6702BF
MKMKFALIIIFFLFSSGINGSRFARPDNYQDIMVLINGRALPAQSAVNLPNILVTNKQTGQEIPLRIGIRKILIGSTENESENHGSGGGGNDHGSGGGGSNNHGSGGGGNDHGSGGGGSNNHGSGGGGSNHGSSGGGSDHDGKNGSNGILVIEM